MSSGSKEQVFAAGGRDPSREEMALREIGVTQVSRPVALSLVAVFLASVVFVPLLQIGKEAPPATRIGGLFSRAWKAAVEAGGSPWTRLMAANGAALTFIDEFEDELEDESVFVNAVLPPTQAALLRLGAGNEKAYAGAGGWLFYRPDVDYLTGSPFLSDVAEKAGPVATIVDFDRQLKARGIELIIVPTPSKAAILPSKFSAFAAFGTLPMDNPAFDSFRRALHEREVAVYEPAPRLIGMGENSYLKTDTHWTPGGMDASALELAGMVRERLEGTDEAVLSLREEEETVRALGDIATMLRLPEDQRLIEPEVVVVNPVIDDAGNLWRPSRDAPVLLLGDSFSNIYSLAAMNWGESAGLAERLSFHLKLPLDAILRNDNGSFATREALARDLGRGVDRLKGKQVVVWQFAVRELVSGNWKPLSLALGAPRETKFVVPPKGEEWLVSGTVEEVSPVPRPGSVPYKDHVVAIHLSDLRRLDGPAQGTDAVVYLMSMSNNAWTDAARLREGMSIRLKLQSWDGADPDFERINRSELADVELQFEEPCWGELFH